MSRQTGFTGRKGKKLTAESFFGILLHDAGQVEGLSLNGIVSYLEDEYGITISKQSLDGRFTKKSVTFVKTVLKEVVEQRLSPIYAECFFEKFNKVRIKDSSKFKLPDNFATDYPGNGGSPAAISIQYEYDLKSNQVLDLTFTSANRNDYTDAIQTCNNVEEDDLIIRDLGYCSAHALQAFVDNRAFFLSRLKSNTTVYRPDGAVMDFVGLYKEMTEKKISQTEIPAVIQVKKKKVSVRMWIALACGEVYEKRVRDRNRENKKRGSKISEETKMRYHFTLFITNAPEEFLPSDKIYPAYRLRWQIELTFKVWKSVFHINGIRKMKQARFFCHLYARMILIMISLQIYSRVQQAVFSCKNLKVRILSMQKAFKTLSMYSSHIIILLRSSRSKAIQIMIRIMNKLTKNHFQEKRKKRTGMIEILELFICKTEI